MRRTVLAAALVPSVLALAACTGSATPSASASASPSAATPSQASSSAAVGDSGNAGLSSAQVVAKYQSALAAGTAAHVKGTLVQGGQSTVLDIQINRNNTSQGTISANGTTIPFISVGGVGYIQYTASLETASKIDPSTQLGKLILNKWAASNTTLGAAYNQGIAPMTSWSSITQLSGPSTDSYTYKGTAALNGQQVVQYNDKSASAGVPDALVSFPASGPMLPVQMSAGSSGGLNFTWNQPTAVTAPAAADLVSNLK